MQTRMFLSSHEAMLGHTRGCTVSDRRAWSLMDLWEPAKEAMKAIP